MKNKKTILIVVLSIVALIVIGVLGWGFYNGYQISSYTEEAQVMVTASEDWDDALMGADEFDFDGMISDINTVKAEAGANLTELDSAKVPNKAEDLHSYLVEYNTLAASVSVAILKEIELIEEEYGSLDEYDAYLDEMDNLTDEEFDAMMDDELEALDEEMATMEDDAFYGDYEEFEKIDNDLEKMEKLKKKIDLEIVALKDTLFSLN